MAPRHVLLRRAGLTLFAFAAPAGLAQTPAHPVTPEIGTSLVQVALGLGVVVLLLVGALHVLKRLHAPRGAAGALLRTVAAIAVGPRERVVVVEIDETWLVVGVAPGRISMLHSLPRSSAATEPGAAPTTPQDFGKWLRQAIGRQGNAR